jgi:hypothetical protein
LSPLLSALSFGGNCSQPQIKTITLSNFVGEVAVKT